MFRTIAKQFRRPEGILGTFAAVVMKNINATMYDKVIKQLNIQEKDMIFEIGYGNGYGVYKIADNYDDVKVHGLDFSEVMHERATKKNMKFIKNGLVRLLHGDIIDYSFDNRYNKVFGINVVYFWKSPVDVFKKVYEALYPSGQFTLFFIPPSQFTKVQSENTDIFNKHETDYLVSELGVAGFKDIKLENHRTLLEKGVIISAYKN